MPRTRHPLDYPVCRVYLRVGLALASWLPLEGPCPKPERPAYEARLARHLELDAAVGAGLLAGYSFQWGRDGRLRRLRLVPHRSLRDTPGIRQLKRLYFGRMC